MNLCMQSSTCSQSGEKPSHAKKKTDAITVVKILMKDFVSRFLMPCRISTDQGTHFTAQMVQELCKALQVKQNFHCLYHSQSAGAVE